MRGVVGLYHILGFLRSFWLVFFFFFALSHSLSPCLSCRYHLLAGKVAKNVLESDPKGICVKILTHLGAEHLDKFQMGQTKVCQNQVLRFFSFSFLFL